MLVQQADVQQEGRQAVRQLACLLERDNERVLQAALVHNLPPDKFLECHHLSNCHTEVSHEAPTVDLQARLTSSVTPGLTTAEQRCSAA